MSNEIDTESVQPPLPKQQQDAPGTTAEMDPRPDHGETSYRGSGLLENRVAVITGGDSGIGRAVAIAFAREGADILISYLDETEDAQETARWVEEAGRRAVLVPGDIQGEPHCRSIIERAVSEFGGIDILVNNAAHQANITELEEFSAEEWDTTFRTNIGSMFHLAKAAVPHMKPGGSIINTASIQASDPSPTLLAYAATKGAIVNFTEGLAQLLAEKGIRVNAVAPGPIWTPLIPATMPADKVSNFGKNTPLGRPGQPAELAGAFVLLASDRGSYITAAVIPVTGGRPF
jgi:NAD(P)-dependent dehydrogenase (short-subunit alcohol dehydrogenase family)